MNYGRYFRLNQSLSKVVDGVAIYDYVDLPAYFGPSVDNPMSPKYPISVSITSDSICFRLHYSSFKIEDKTRKEEPRYAYNKIEDIDKKAWSFDDKENPKRIRMAHMEEMILELPYTDSVSNKLSDTIKSIYNSKFPLHENEKEEMGGEKTNYGGRFLEQLIYKRYPNVNEWKSVENLKEEGDIEALMYGTLREAFDDTPSYSTLWLMDLMRNVSVKGFENRNRINLYDEKEGRNIIAFLRKLLLDFMFDLKHSDVFQNSVHYQKMYSKLMSDFYFSSLMHKCEYYYYRKLTSKAIEDVEDSYKTKKKIIKSKNLAETERKKEVILIEKEKEERTKAIEVLYANELIKAEDLWIKDIMNPQAEKDFEYKYPGKHNLLREIFEYYSFKQWPMWFAEPEEEMRRVCFTMKDKTGEGHICNADTLIEYLDVEYQKEYSPSLFQMSKTRDDNREKISRWFLKRYDFNDVMHLHFFKWSNIAFLLVTTFFLFSMFGWNEWITRISGFTRSCKDILILPAFFLLCLILIHNIILSEDDIALIINRWKDVFSKKVNSKLKNSNTLQRVRIKLTWKRFVANVFYVLTFVSLLYMLFESKKEVIAVMLSLILSFVFLLYVVNKRLKFWPSIHLISNLHLLFPRLVAAITAAWFAMSMGFDIYVSFFDQLPQWYTALAISIIVFGFIMYEINRIMPSSISLRKIYRSFEFLVISYCISLLVGLVVINFVGEKYLERGGYMESFYSEYVKDHGKSHWNSLEYKRLNELKDTSSIYGKVEALTKIGHKKKNDSLIVIQSIFGTKHDLFIMRDFLIMFSFIAMFWGIFIQMIFTGEKQMTEL